MGKFLLRIYFLLFASSVLGQTSFVISEGLRVTSGSEVLERAFEGGMRNAQYQAFDLNNDGSEDLVVFDRSSRRIMTFLAVENTYEYAPSYEQYFPEEINHWIVLVDFDCDGKKDLFTSSLFGMSLFHNTSSGSTLTWELLYETVFTEGSNGQINLQVSSGDYPAIRDVDGDGDVDILVFDFASGGGVQYHQNMSIEKTGQCALDLERVTRKFGDFEECSCETYIFGSEVCPEGGRLEHSGGKTILNFDLTNSGQNDLVIGQEYCSLTGFLENEGNNALPIFTSVNFNFPNSAEPVTLDFPAYFMLDADLDGDLDILSAPNSIEINGVDDLSRSSWWYVNEGGAYNQNTKGFLQEEMIDVGVNAKPALTDIDQDGDIDLLLASGAHKTGARIVYYRNEGTKTDPQFELVDNDFLSLEASRYVDISIQTIDLNNDGLDELVVTKSGQSIATEIYYHSGNFLQPYVETNKDNLTTPTLDFGDHPVLEDVDDNGNFDLVVGRTGGNLSYFRNEGSLQAPTWTLITDSLLNIAEDFNARNVHVAFGDVNANSQRDALIYSDARALYLIGDYRNTMQREDNLIYDSLSNSPYDHSFGNKSFPTIGPIFGSEQSVIIGLASGGVNLLRNTNSISNEEEVPIRVTVYPNPLGVQNALKIISNQQVRVSVYDTKGNLIASEVSVNKLEEEEIVLNFLRQGLYILRFVNNKGNAISKTVVLTK